LLQTVVIVSARGSCVRVFVVVVYFIIFVVIIGCFLPARFRSRRNIQGFSQSDVPGFEFYPSKFQLIFLQFMAVEKLKITNN